MSYLQVYQLLHVLHIHAGQRNIYLRLIQEKRHDITADLYTLSRSVGEARCMVDVHLQCSESAVSRPRVALLRTS
jgi:hypothetical protein